ncbi:12024_t:CDS:2 [Ambispora gerdemannii]|uniref:12024_t:CDS:1 n=1 Tax=Ambispora gerdemannii TaxID=144530 RepID=A0A9N9CIL8_9GLOM|nr:12024_t:CDS:2 [Ambispora gerdemannii]
MVTEETSRDSTTFTSKCNDLEAFSLNYLRSQNILQISDNEHIPKLSPCNLCNKSIFSFRFEGTTKYSTCPTCKTDIEILKKSHLLLSNVTIEDDEGELEIIRNIELIEEDSVPAEQVSKKDQIIIPIADNSISMQDQATNSIINKDNNVLQENFKNQTNENNESNTNVYVTQDSIKQLKLSNSKDQINDMTKTRSSRQSSPKIDCDQDKLEGLLQELFTSIKGETNKNENDEGSETSISQSLA